LGYADGKVRAYSSVYRTCGNHLGPGAGADQEVGFMQLTIARTDNDVTHVHCDGSITQEGFKPGNDPLDQLIGVDGYKRHVLLNLDRTHYIDSSGVSWLMTRNRQFRQSGGRFILHSIPPMVGQVLTLLKMGKVLEMAADEPAALARLRGENQQ
jgi:anti-anti-sigma factor